MIFGCETDKCAKIHEKRKYYMAVSRYTVAQIQNLSKASVGHIPLVQVGGKLSARFLTIILFLFITFS